jgi:hypothetical protein
MRSSFRIAGPAVATCLLATLLLQGALATVAASEATSLTDDLESYPSGAPPTGWLLRGAEQVFPVISDVGGTYGKVLAFPSASGSLDRWVLKGGQTFSGPFTMTVKMRFLQAVADRAGVTIGWKDDAWSRIDIQPNVYWDNIEFRNNSGGGGDYTVTGSAVSRGGLRIAPNTDYWLRVAVTTLPSGDGSIAVSWSTDGSAFTEVLLAQGPSLAGPVTSGLIGVGTAGPKLPAVWFDDVRVRPAASPQAITFPAIPDQTYGDPAVKLEATASSGLPIKYVVTDGPCSIVGANENKLKANGAGTCSVKAKQPGNADYLPADPKTRTAKVKKAPLTATCDDKERWNLLPNPPLTVSYAGFVGGEGRGVLGAQPNCDTTATKTSPAGDYRIACSGGSDDDYRITCVDGTLTVVYKPPITYRDNQVRTGDFYIRVGDKATGNVTVKDGTLKVEGVVSGNVIQEEQGSVIVNGGSIKGNIDEVGDGDVIVNHGGNVGGNIAEHGTGSVRVYQASLIKGNVSEAWDGDVVVKDAGTVVTRNVTEAGNGDLVVKNGGVVKVNVCEQDAGNYDLDGADWIGRIKCAGLNLPFAFGETWTVCQGYNGTVSHSGNDQFALDLSIDPDSASESGCWNSEWEDGDDPNEEGGRNASRGQTVTSPAAGQVASFIPSFTQDDIVCIDIVTGGSIAVGHVRPDAALKVGEPVLVGDTIGKVLEADKVGGREKGYAHIHVSVYANEGCYYGKGKQGAVAQEFIGDFKFECVDPMPKNGETNQYGNEKLSRRVRCNP